MPSLIVALIGGSAGAGQLIIIASVIDIVQNNWAYLNWKHAILEEKSYCQQIFLSNIIVKHHNTKCIVNLNV